MTGSNSDTGSYFANLSSNDLQTIIQSLVEVSDPSIDQTISERRHSLFVRTSSLLAADAWVWATGLRNMPGSDDFVFAGAIEGGTNKDEKETELLTQICNPGFPQELIQLSLPNWRQKSIDSSPSFPAAFATIIVRPDIDKARQKEDVPSEQIQIKDLKNQILGIYPIEDFQFSFIAFLRHEQSEPFTPREQGIVDLTFKQTGWVHRAGRIQDLGELALGLTERQRQVLTYLLNGDSTKAIAARLSLSHHTIGDYIKFIYKQFKVNSRSELLSKFISK